MGLIASICIGVYVAWKKWPAERPIPTGIYRISIVGRNKLTGAVEYKFDAVELDKDGVGEHG